MNLPHAVAELGRRTRHRPGQRNHRLVLFGALTGAVTGLGVAGFERLVSRGALDNLLDAPLWLKLILPTLGLVVAAVALRVLAGNASPSTADEYVKNFHERDRRLPLKPVVGRLVASIATLASGCALGFEGPSIYFGAAVGSALQRRLSHFFSRDDAKVLLVAGAAAGVAAIFKAPATGALFALEVPYRDDLARRMLLPTLFSAAAAYVVFVAVNGTEPLFALGGTPALDTRDLAGAVVVGLAAGLAARGFATVLVAAKRLAARTRPLIRVPAAGAAIAALIALGQWLTGRSLVFGPGYQTVIWAVEPKRAVGVVLGLLLLRGAATTAAVAGGGAGGLFIPLVIEGTLLGRAAGAAFHAQGPTLSLFTVLGVAAFLGAGYRVPLAAVMFVAESTGKAGFVVPGLIAAAASQLTVGRATVAPLQRARQAGHLEGRIGLPITSVLRTDAATVPPDATLTELFNHHVVEVRLLSVPVVNGAAYLGMVHLDDMTQVDRDAWDDTPVSDVMRSDEPVADLTWNLGQALSALEAGDVDRMAVLDDGAFVGIVTTGEILKLGDILDTTARGPLG